jgi:hypothetical protein
VLAHSLRDAGTTKKLAVLITEDSVSADAIAQLRVRFYHLGMAGTLLTVYRTFTTSSSPWNELSTNLPRTYSS